MDLFDVMALCEEWSKKGDINGHTVNQENLDKFNKANILAIKLFKPKNIRISPPQQNLSFAEAYINATRVEFEGAKQLETFKEFIDLIDYFNVSSITETEVSISYDVDNVWEGEQPVSLYAVLTSTQDGIECKKFNELDPANEYAKNKWNAISDKTNSSIEVVKNLSEHSNENAIDSIQYEFQTAKGGFNSKKL